MKKRILPLCFAVVLLPAALMFAQPVKDAPSTALVAELAVEAAPVVAPAVEPEAVPVVAPVVEPAAEPVAEPTLVGTAASLYSALTTKAWGKAAVLVFLLGVLIIRKVGWPAWFKTRWGGWALNLGAASAGFVLLANAAGATIGLRVILEGLLLGFSGAGIVEFIKDTKKGNNTPTARLE